jgi:hypothetical protein
MIVWLGNTAGSPFALNPGEFEFNFARQLRSERTELERVGWPAEETYPGQKTGGRSVMHSA